MQVQVLVIGSGAGGATTAATLAGRGFQVLLLEEGRRRFDNRPIDPGSIDSMQNLYRNCGMTPIMGSIPVAYVEGCCLGGSTEINSGFWHHLPPEMILRWQAHYGLQLSAEDLQPNYQWAEQRLQVSLSRQPLPKSSQVFADGIKAMDWSAQEIPRIGGQAAYVEGNQLRRGTGQGMSRNLIPEAEASGALVMSGCRVKLLLKKNGRITGCLADWEDDEGRNHLLRIDSEYVFVCGGAMQTPAILRRSGIKFHIGDSLRIHPMLKVSARFKQDINAQDSILPLLQVKEFWPDISLGGAFFSPGHLGLLLSDNWPSWSNDVLQYKHMASFYVGVRGTGKGSVRPSMFGEGQPSLQYEVNDVDLRYLSEGLSRLSTLLLAAGAQEVYAGVQDMPAIKSQMDAVIWLDQLLPRKALSLSTVHAFSTCPIGERRDRCAADSFGKVFDFDNLYINDASMLPDSPGINPQGTIMALARRNAQVFAESHA